MARKTKKETALSPEDKMSHALVTQTEQLFLIPPNWSWCYLQSFSKICTGKKDANYGSENGKYYFFTCAAEPIRSSGYSFEGNYILLAGNGDISNIQIYDGKFEAYQRTYVLSVNQKINTEFIYYYFKYMWVDYNIDKMYGTAIPYVRLGNLQFFPVPIAPCTEQQRIVDRIENLFTKLDEAKEKAQEVIERFDDRRSAILSKAFSGELTQEWREKNCFTLDSWTLLNFNDCIDTMQNGLAKRKGTSGKPYVVLRLANLSDNGFLTNDLRTILLDKNEQNHYELHNDDVLMIRVNGSKDNVGKQYRIAEQKKWAFCDHLIRIKYSNKIVPQYMVFFSMSKDYRSYVADNTVSTAGQNTISRKGMANLQIPVPLIEEQKEIVYLLDILFAKEQQAKETAEQIIEQIEVIKKAILARAFRGELGTNDPNDEPAIELLKRVLSEESTKENEPKPAKKRITIPKEINSKLSTALERKIIKLYFEMDTNELTLDDIFSVSSKKFNVLDSIRTLEKKQIIIKEDNGKYRLVG